jgi:hypothetical protein
MVSEERSAGSEHHHVREPGCENFEKIEGTLESRLAADIGGEVLRAPDGFLLRAHGMDRLFRDTAELRLELADLVARTREDADSGQVAFDEVRDRRVPPRNIADRKGAMASVAGPRTASNQGDNAPRDSLLQKRLGPFTIARGRRSLAKDGRLATIIESRGGELWRMWDGTWVTVFEGVERRWPSFSHITHFTNLLDQQKAQPWRMLADETERVLSYREKIESGLTA